MLFAKIWTFWTLLGVKDSCIIIKLSNTQEYLHEGSIAHPPNPCNTARSIVHFVRKTPATTTFLGLGSGQAIILIMQV